MHCVVILDLFFFSFILVTCWWPGRSASYRGRSAFRRMDVAKNGRSLYDLLLEDAESRPFNLNIELQDGSFLEIPSGSVTHMYGYPGVGKSSFISTILNDRIQKPSLIIGNSKFSFLI